jgi:MoxR-like ATPase
LTTSAAPTEPTPVPYPGGLLRALGLYGLSHLDAPVLAALASDATMLLIGPHGTAKSALLERLSEALQLDHRHYNASLLSFDDLVGFPVPDGDTLRYLRTPATLWGAQSVFLDEISRCRPEVQNKLFSIVHERKVQGIRLESLRYRWAAMNPPSAIATDDACDEYLGSQPLDPALADRFSFVLTLPALEDLAHPARRDVIRSGLTREVLPLPDIAGLVEQCRRGIALRTELLDDWVTLYTASLINPLRQAGIGISGRRAPMIAANIIAVHAALEVLGRRDEAAGLDDKLDEAALIALHSSMPHRAQGRLVDPGILTTIHRKAVTAASMLLRDQEVAAVLSELDPVHRVGLALALLEANPRRIWRSTMSSLVADALTTGDVQSQWLLSLELLPRIAALDCVDASTLELLSAPFRRQLEFELGDPGNRTFLSGGTVKFDLLSDALNGLSATDPDQITTGNLISTLFRHNPSAVNPDTFISTQAALRHRLAPRSNHA